MICHVHTHSLSLSLLSFCALYSKQAIVQGSHPFNPFTLDNQIHFSLHFITFTFFHFDVFSIHSEISCSLSTTSLKLIHAKRREREREREREQNSCQMGLFMLDCNLFEDQNGKISLKSMSQHSNVPSMQKYTVDNNVGHKIKTTSPAIQVCLSTSVPSKTCPIPDKHHQQVSFQLSKFSQNLPVKSSTIEISL